MSSKLLVIIATGEKEKAMTVLMYAHNAMKNGWLEDIKVVFFGPSERLIARDEQVADIVKDVALVGESFACKAISDREDISEDVEKLGVEVEYVGSIISGLIEDGQFPPWFGEHPSFSRAKRQGIHANLEWILGG